jgi:hypothetical protein
METQTEVKSSALSIAAFFKKHFNSYKASTTRRARDMVQGDCASRKEGTCSAASVAQNEKSLSSAIANQTPGQVEQNHSAMLLV